MKMSNWNKKSVGMFSIYVCLIGLQVALLPFPLPLIFELFESVVYVQIFALRVAWRKQSE
jgi:hypothetical protein